MISLKSHYSKILNAVCHFEINDDNGLVVTIDFDNRSFADMEYLKLIGEDVFKEGTKFYQCGKTTTEIVKENYERDQS